MEDHIPLRRNEDPSPSHEAARHAAAKLAALKQAARDAVVLWPGRTSKELAKLMALDDNRDVGRRLPELVEDGVLIRGPKRTCTVSGMTAGTWFAKGHPKS